MAFQGYSQGLLELADGTLDWDGDSFYAVLVDSSYTYSAAHTTYADVSSDEITDEDYDPVAISGADVSLDSGDVLYDCDNISFGDPVTIDAASGSLIILAGDYSSPQAGDRLLFRLALSAGAASTNSEFTITTGDGVYRIEPQ